jgi:hypothetical protein
MPDEPTEEDLPLERQELTLADGRRLILYARADDEEDES